MRAGGARWRLVLHRAPHDPLWHVHGTLVDPGSLGIAAFKAGEVILRLRESAGRRYEGEQLWKNIFGASNWAPAQVAPAGARSIAQSNQPRWPSAIGTQFSGVARHPQVAATAPAESEAVSTAETVPSSDEPERKADEIAPTLTVPRRVTTEDEWIEFDGVVSDDALTRVMVDGIEVGVRSDGSFRTRQRVRAGSSVVVVVAVDAHGNETARKISVARLTDESQDGDEAAATSADFGNYHALIIGNNDYRHLPKLDTAVNDAHALAGLLRNTYRFEVKVLTNATRSEIVSSLTRLRRDLHADDNLLVYYAGHGYVEADTQEGYWLPVDALPHDSVDWVSNSTITTNLKGMKARHVMVVADSCYSGSLSRGVNFAPQRSRDYLSRLSSKVARVVITSGGLEPVSDSGGDGHSVFARHFLSALRDNGAVLEGARLFLQIQRPIIENARQTPEYGTILYTGHDGGDFLFVRR